MNMNGYSTGSHEDAVEVIIANLLANKTVFLWGDAGMGKSAIGRMVADRLYDGVIMDVRPVQTTSVDWRGVPHVTDDGYSDFAPPKGLLPIEAIHGPRGLLLLDEVNAVQDRDVLATLYELVYDRRVGKQKIPEGWGILACGNLATSKAIVSRFSAAASNRGAHIFMERDVDNWVWWAANQPIDQDVVQFVKSHPQALYADPIEQGAFASPRSVTMAAEVLLTARAAGFNVNRRKVLSAWCGVSFAGAYTDWEKTRSEIVTLPEILSGELRMPRTERGWLATINQVAPFLSGEVELGIVVGWLNSGLANGRATGSEVVQFITAMGAHWPGTGENTFKKHTEVLLAKAILT